MRITREAKVEIDHNPAGELASDAVVAVGGGARDPQRAGAYVHNGLLNPHSLNILMANETHVRD